MPNLKFKITGDESELRKSLARVKKELSDQAKKDFDNAIQGAKSVSDSERKKRQEISETTKELEKQSQTRRKTILSDSQAEVEAYKRSRVGDSSVKGSVLNTNDKKIAEMTNAATALSSAQSKLSENTSKASQKLTEQITPINTLKLRMESYKNIVDSASDPKRISEYNKKIQETEKEITKLSNAGKQGFDTMGNKIKESTSLTSKFKDNLLTIGSAVGLAFGLQTIVQFGVELFGISKKAEGIELAFSRLNNSRRVLEDLRVATKGNVSDLLLMQTAVKAKDFQIPMDVLAKGLAFAQQKAKDTGKDVNYLVNSFVDGLGRKSTLILDNLNISTIEVQNEMKKTGDFATAVGNVIDRQMRAAGTQVDNLSDKTGNMARMWDNAKTSVADFFRQLMNPELADPKKIAELTTQYSKSFSNFGSYNSSQQKEVIGNFEKLIAKQSASYNKARENFQKQGGGQFQDLKLSNEGEVLKAMQNVHSNLIAQNKELEKKERKQKGILSIAELEEELQDMISKRDNELDNKSRASLNKEIKEKQKLISSLNGSDSKGLEKEGREREASLERQYNLQKRIFDLQNRYTLKSLTKDESEIQSVRDEFKQIAEEVKRFNADPKNKFKVSGAELDKVRDQAIADLRYSQDTEKLKIELEIQKDLFQKYEAYKESVNKESADKRFENEKKQFENYGQYIQSEIDKIGSVDLTGPMLERKKALVKSLDEYNKTEKEKQDQRFIEALQASQTYEQKKADIEKKFQKQKDGLLTLPANEYAERAKVLDQAEKMELNDLKDANVQKLKVFQDLYQGIEDLSDKSARKVISDARDMLNELIKAGKISPELAKEIEKSLKNTSKAIDDRLPQKLSSLAGELRNVAGEVSGIDTQFGNLLSTVSNVIGSVGNMKSSLDAIKTAQSNKDVLGGITGGIGLAGGAFSAITSIISLFDKSEEKRARADAQFQYSQELQIKAIEAQSKAMERQLALIKDIYGTERLKKYGDAAVDLQNRMAESANNIRGKYLLTGNQLENEILTKINAGQSKKEILNGKNPISDVSYFEAYGYLLEKINNGQIARITVSDSLAENYAEIERLQKLLDEGKLDAVTAAQVQNLINYAEQYREILKAVKEEATGVTFAEVSDSLIDLFTKGSVAAADFAKNFEDLMKKSILNSFKRNSLEKELQAFYDKFAEYAKSGDQLTEAEIALLRKEYDRIISEGEKKFADMSKATGIDFSNSETSKQGELAKGIQGIQESTANRIEGEFGGLRVAQLQNLEVAKSNSLTLAQQADIADRSLTQLIAIQNNTYVTSQNTGELFAIRSAIESMNNKISNSDAIRRGAGL